MYPGIELQILVDYYKHSKMCHIRGMVPSESLKYLFLLMIVAGEVLAMHHKSCIKLCISTPNTFIKTKRNYKLLKSEEK